MTDFWSLLFGAEVALVVVAAGGLALVAYGWHEARKHEED